jgi:hypothetical protein
MILDDEGAERVGEGRFASGSPRFGQADSALEELPAFVDEGDERDGSPGEGCGQLGQSVELRFRRCIEHPVLPEVLQSRGCVLPASVVFLHDAAVAFSFSVLVVK